jgi:[ribosomal protein S18]-alanine N-acetyltransferase
VTRVREAGPADASAVAALASAALREPWSAAGYADELALPGVRALLALVPEPAGFLLARRVCDELHVLAVAVAPARRRRGLGRALLDEALRRAAREGLREVQLEVRAGNAAARVLYAGLGFAEVGRRPRYYRDGEDALLLSLRLGEPVRGARPARRGGAPPARAGRAG